MKKRVAAIVGLALVVMMVFPMAAMAKETGDFKITETSPVDGAKGTTKDNMCVKLFFNQDVDKVGDANKRAITITDADGKKIPTKIYYSKKDSKYALVIVDTDKVAQTDIKDSMEYTCTIDKSFRDNDGDTLGKTTKISFKTMNQKRDTLIYMVLMTLVMVGMFAFSAKSALGKQLSGEDDEDTPQTQVPFNPYKEAKKTGKSVDEVIREHQKEVEKQQKKKAKKNTDAKATEEKDPKRDGEAYVVKKRAPIAAAGGQYKSGLKAKFEEEARRKAEEKAARKASNYGKKKDEPKKRY